MKKVVLSIDGMMCGMCEAHIKDAIRKSFPSAKKVTASHMNGEASFLLDPNPDQSQVKEALSQGVESLGYRIISVDLQEAQAKKGFFASIFGK